MSKIRLGFISNSSSSSFITTIAIITDEEKFSKFEESSGFKFERFTYDQICKNYSQGYFYDYLSKPDEKYSNATFVHEYDMADMDETEDMDYDDVLFDEFSDQANALYSAGEDEGIKIIDQAAYSGRNG